MSRQVVLMAATLLLAAAPARSAILYQQVVTADNGIAEFSDFVPGDQLSGSGLYWIGLEGGTIQSLSYYIDFDYTKLWWEDLGPDENDQPVPNLTGNDYFGSIGCEVTVLAPSCGVAQEFQSRLKNKTVRIDFVRPQSFNICNPFNGVFDVDCAVLYDFKGASLGLTASGLGDVTLTIYNTPLAGAVPEPTTWALLIGGFGTAGTAMRRHRSAAA